MTLQQKLRSEIERVELLIADLERKPNATKAIQAYNMKVLVKHVKSEFDSYDKIDFQTKISLLKTLQ